MSAFFLATQARGRHCKIEHYVRASGVDYFFCYLDDYADTYINFDETGDCPTDIQAFRERELRGQLLATAARLGHGLIDLYAMTMSRLESFELRAQEAGDEEGDNPEVGRIFEYLDLLERQMREAREGRDWGTFDELREISENYDLILDVNAPEVRHQPLAESGRAFGQLLRQQQPIGGMSGQVNQTLVRQFRMPGYPLVLITTDLLQEGEDLHTFCSAVHHYGISWTPSSMEQRIGRIDRVRSQTDRRLSALKSPKLDGDNKLQVYFPHLEDTVELLQVQRVLERMNVFLKLMHEGLIDRTGCESTRQTMNSFCGHSLFANPSLRRYPTSRFRCGKGTAPCR